MAAAQLRTMEMDHQHQDRKNEDVARKQKNKQKKAMKIQMKTWNREKVVEIPLKNENEQMKTRKAHEN